MKILGTLDRYVIRSVMVPAVLAFFVYTFLLMMRPIFNLIEQIFVRGLPAEDALKIALISLPHVVVMTIPLSYLFGVLLAVGRMNADNEIIALQAGGVSALRLLPPIMLVAIIMAGVNAYLFLDIIPRSSERLREIQARAFTSAKNIGRIQPKVFYEDFQNILLYIEDIDQETGIWKHVLIYDTTEHEERLTLAQRGQLLVTPEQRSEYGNSTQTMTPGSGEPWLLLEDVVAHQINPAKPSMSRVNAIKTHMMKIPTGDTTVSYSPGIRERSTAELIQFVRTGGEKPKELVTNGPESRRKDNLKLAGIELHRRLSIPAACLVFALLALPLGIGSGSSGKGRGFVMSILVILVYFVMSSNGEMFALKGRVPVWLGMWFPNILLTVIALFLMGRMGRWLGERQKGTGWVARLIRGISLWIRKLQERRLERQHAAELTGSIPIGIQRRRYANRFPTLLDRHMIRRLLLPLTLVLVSTSALYVVVDLSGKLDDIAENSISPEIIVAYYFKLVPQVIHDVIPMGLMISVLILLTVLERQHELTALKSAGVSLYRVMLPVLLVGIVSVGAMYFLETTVVPSANREAKRLQDVIKGRDNSRMYRADDRMWLLSRDGTTFYKFLRYDAKTQTLARFAMFRLDEDMRLRFHLVAHRIRYENGKWIAGVNSGWFRQFYPDGRDEFRKITSEMEVGIPEGPDYFGQEFRHPSEMSPNELQDYIQELSDSGYRPTKLMVRWHQKYVSPLSALVFVLLALPFGLNRGGKRISTMQGIGVALGIGIGYFLLVALLGKMGEADLLSPAVGAWAPFILACLFALNRLSMLRT